MFKYKKQKFPLLLAQDYPNKIKLGNDGLEYISKPNKNNIFKWIKIKNMEDCKSASVYYMQFPENYLQKNFYKYKLNFIDNNLKIIKKELEKEHIYLFKIGWKKSYNYLDFAWEYARTYIFKKYIKKTDIKIDTSYNIMDYANFIFYTEKNEFFFQNDGELSIQWNLDKKSKIYAFQIFKKYFKTKFIEPKNSTNAIIIKIK